MALERSATTSGTPYVALVSGVTIRADQLGGTAAQQSLTCDSPETPGEKTSRFWCEEEEFNNPGGDNTIASRQVGCIDSYNLLVLRHAPYPRLDIVRSQDDFGLQILILESHCVSKTHRRHHLPATR